MSSAWRTWFDWTIVWRRGGPSYGGCRCEVAGQAVSGGRPHELHSKIIVLMKISKEILNRSGECSTSLNYQINNLSFICYLFNCNLFLDTVAKHRSASSVLQLSDFVWTHFLYQTELESNQHNRSLTKLKRINKKT